MNMKIFVGSKQQEDRKDIFSFLWDLEAVFSGSGFFSGLENLLLESTERLSSAH
jgi:hypothetical protein